MKMVLFSSKDLLLLKWSKVVTWDSIIPWDRKRINPLGDDILGNPMGLNSLLMGVKLSAAGSYWLIHSCIFSKNCMIMELSLKCHQSITYNTQLSYFLIYYSLILTWGCYHLNILTLFSRLLCLVNFLISFWFLRLLPLLIYLSRLCQKSI